MSPSLDLFFSSQSPFFFYSLIFYRSLDLILSSNERIVTDRTGPSSALPTSIAT